MEEKTRAEACSRVGRVGGAGRGQQLGPAFESNLKPRAMFGIALDKRGGRRENEHTNLRV